MRRERERERERQRERDRETEREGRGLNGGEKHASAHYHNGKIKLPGVTPS